MSILFRDELKELAQAGMIQPFVPETTRQWNGIKVISFGLGDAGYDIRLNPEEFFIFQDIGGFTVDPKAFDPDFLRRATLHHDNSGFYYVLPGYSYGLGVSLERFEMPLDVTAVATGKSTYARAGIVLNLTPLEPGWKGWLTLELTNTSPAPVKVYANEGIAQIQFHRGSSKGLGYGQRNLLDGKYQDQEAKVVVSRV